MSLYRQQYNAARSLFHETDNRPCIREAEKNLSDPTLPLYFVVKKCMLIACVLDDWDDADIWQSRAEHHYDMCLKDATRKNDTASLDRLRGLRKELDQLQEFKMEDLTGTTKEQREKFNNEEIKLNPSFEFFLRLQNMDPDITEDEEDDEDDEDSTTAAENEMELAADKLGDKRAVAAVEDEMETAVDNAQLPARFVVISRPKITNRGKGGSYHAQVFSRSLGKGSKSSD